MDRRARRDLLSLLIAGAVPLAVPALAAPGGDAGRKPGTCFAAHAAPPAPQRDAEEEDEEEIPLLDVGLTAGLNNPGGLYGLETDLRVEEWLSAGVAGGMGLWGPRVTPQVRIYPLGAVPTALFIEGGVSINLGGQKLYTVESPPRLVELGLVPTVNLAVGLRQQLFEHGWVALRLGYQLSLYPGTFASTDGAPLSDAVKVAIRGQQPGGPAVGLSLGAAFL